MKNITVLQTNHKNDLSQEIFSKEEAIAIFAERRRNRNIRRSGVQKWMQKMNSGNWSDSLRNEEPVLFDKNGLLAGGQHRFEAFIKSDLQEIIFLVLRNATEEEIAMQDSNINRTVNDRVIMYHDIPKFTKISHTALCAAAKLIIRYYNEQSSELNMSVDEPENISNILKNYETIINTIDENLLSKSKMKNHSAVLAAFIVAESSMPLNLWTHCITKLDDLSMLENTSPILRLNEMITHLSKGYSNEDRWDVFIKTLNCLRAVKNNKPVKRVSFDKSVLKRW